MKHHTFWDISGDWTPHRQRVFPYRPLFNCEAGSCWGSPLNGCDELLSKLVPPYIHKLGVLPLTPSLVLEHDFFSHSVGNFIIPANELIFFRGVETINQISFLDLGGCWCPKFRRPLRNDPETSFAQGELWCERWGAQQGVTGFWFGSMDWFRGGGKFTGKPPI